jgi:hypothetical protein
VSVRVRGDGATEGRARQGTSARGTGQCLACICRSRTRRRDPNAQREGMGQMALSLQSAQTQARCLANVQKRWGASAPHVGNSPANTLSLRTRVVFEMRTGLVHCRLASHITTG